MTTAIGTSRLAILRLAAHRRDRFESDQNQNGDGRLNEHPREVVDSNYRACARMSQEDALVVVFGIVDDERHRLAGSVKLRLGDHVRVADDAVGRRTVSRHLLRLKLIGVRVARR